MQGIWKVMQLSKGEIKAIGRADGPEPVGRTLRIEGLDYEVVSYEGDLNEGWIYVTRAIVPALP